MDLYISDLTDFTNFGFIHFSSAVIKAVLNVCCLLLRELLQTAFKFRQWTTLTIWFIVLYWPHSQRTNFARPHLCWFVRHVWKQMCQGRSKPWLSDAFGLWKLSIFGFVDNLVQPEHTVSQFGFVMYILQYKTKSAWQIIWCNRILLCRDIGWLATWCLLCQLVQPGKSVWYYYC